MKYSDLSRESTARLICGIAREDHNCPITVVPGDSPPEKTGHKQYWGATRRGYVCKRYAMYYHAATRVITVGANWAAPEIRRTTIGGAEFFALCGSRTYLHGIRCDAGYYPSGKSGYLLERDGKYYHSHASTLRGAVREAVAAWLRQRKMDRACGNGRPLDQIMVSAADSIAAGNCPEGTAQFVRQLPPAIQESGQIRADHLLSIRSDSYTRRAVSHAAAGG